MTGEGRLNGDLAGLELPDLTPIITMSGSARKMLLSALAKVSPAFGLVWI